MLTTISRLWSALARLAGALEDLAGTVEETNHGLRSQLAMPGPVNRQPLEIETLTANGTEHPGNGRAKGRSAQRQ